MSWRIIQISKPCSLSVKSSQLLYKTNDDEISVPLEDVSVLVIESHHVNLTNYLLAECAANNIIVFSCDKTHMPSGVFLPFQNHSRYSEHSFIQVETTLPLKKRLWQKIVTAKILNQSAVMLKTNPDIANKIKGMADKVQSGDSSNVEAVAASIYWKNLFANFKRGAECPKNASLNYGYAILRGAIARDISASGLLPCFGLHHSNKLNAFNLADDMIEPFRPFVDRIVVSMDLSNDEELTSKHKQILISVLTENIIFNDQSMIFLNVIEKCIKTLLEAFKTKDVNALKLPLL